jgi:hypothetical protein
MSTKDLAVVDDGTDLVPVDGRKRQTPAPASTRAGHDLDVGGSNVGGAGGDERALTLDGDDDGRRELVEHDDVDASGFPRVKGVEWKPEDKQILESFGDVADEIDLSTKQRDRLAAWYTQDVQELIGAPSDASDYHFESITDDALENPMIDGMVTSFKQLAYTSGMSAESADNLVHWFVGQSKAVVTARDAEDREASIAEAGRDWGDSHAENVRTTRQYLSDLGEVGKTLRNARAADGRRLIFSPGIPQLLHEMAVADKNPETKVSSGFVDATKLRREAEALRTLLREKRDEYYHREWRSTGKTGDARLLEIQAELEGLAKGTKNSSAAKGANVSEERRELARLERTDPDFYEHGRYKDYGISPAARMHEIATRGK